MANDTLSTVLIEAASAIRAFRPRLQTPSTRAALVRDLGWPDAMSAALEGMKTSVDDVDTLLERLSIDGIQPRSALQLLDSFSALMRALQQIATIADTMPELANQAQRVPLRLFDLIALDYALDRHPSLVAVFGVLGFVREIAVPSISGRPAFIDRRLAVEDLPLLFRDPSAVLRMAFGWGSPDFRSDIWFSWLISLFNSIGIRADSARISDVCIKAVEGVVPAERSLAVRRRGRR